MPKENKKELMIRNSTAEFLIFTKQSGGDGIEVRVANKNLWLTQKLLSKLYDIDRSVITKHLKNIFNENELEKETVCAIFAHTAEDGKDYQTEFYSLEAIIAVGYRVNSQKAIEFRQWATRVLKQFVTHGWVIHKENN